MLQLFFLTIIVRLINLAKNEAKMYTHIPTLYQYCFLVSTKKSWTTFHLYTVLHVCNFLISHMLNYISCAIVGINLVMLQHPCCIITSSCSLSKLWSLWIVSLKVKLFYEKSFFLLLRINIYDNFWHHFHGLHRTN